MLLAPDGPHFKGEPNEGQVRAPKPVTFVFRHPLFFRPEPPLTTPPPITLLVMTALFPSTLMA